MNEIVLRREADLLAACLKRGACTPEQIWPSSAAGGQGPALSLLFSPLFLKDRTKGLSRELDKHLSQCFHSSPSMDFSLGGRQASSPSLRYSSSMIYEPSRYTYLYLPRLPGGDSSEDWSRSGPPSPYCLQKSLSHSAHSGKTCQDRRHEAGGSGSWLGSFTAGYGRQKVHPVRSSEEARRVAQILQRQRALRLGDIILLDADDACVEVLLPHISRPSTSVSIFTSPKGKEAALWDTFSSFNDRCCACRLYKLLQLALSSGTSCICEARRPSAF